MPSAIAASSSGWRSGRPILAIRRRPRTTDRRASGGSAVRRTRRTSSSFWRRTTSGVLDDLVALLKLRARDAASHLIFEQRGDTLPGDLRGHEHFGFKDGISQPGVRGKLSAAPGDYITPRYIAAADDRRLYLAKPGQQLVVAGTVSPRRAAAEHGRPAQCHRRGVELSEVGDARLVSGRSPAAAGCPGLLQLRRARGGANRDRAGQVRRDARRPVAERRADPARARRRQSGAGRRRFRQQPLHLRRRHAAVVAASDPRAIPATRIRRRRRISWRRSVRTSPTSAKFILATRRPRWASPRTASRG